MLHGYLQPNSPARNITSDVVEISAVEPDVANNKSPLLSTKPADSGINPDPDQQPDFLAALHAGNYNQGVNLCIQSLGKGDNPCRDQLIQFSESGNLSQNDSRFLLELWLGERPEDVDAGSILVKRAIADERFVEAIELLISLKSYQTDIVALDKISQRVQHLARTAISRLNLRGELNRLKTILTRMVEIEPERAAWRYSLAEILQELELYNDAISALTYILYDPDYGDRATTLYNEVTRQVNLASYTAVPLQRAGSQLLVSAILNGRHRVTLLLDTGASITAIDINVLRRLGLNPTSNRTITLNTAGGPIRSSLINLAGMDIGGQKINGIDIASIPFDEDKFDGLLGMNFLNKFRFIIDQKQRKLYLIRK